MEETNPFITGDVKKREDPDVFGDVRKRVPSEVSYSESDDDDIQRIPSEVSLSNEYSLTESTLTAAVEGLVSDGCPCHQLREDGPSLMLQDQPGHVNPASKFLESF